MDECEFLCNRLAIMNSGQLNCIGPILELKKTFALGFLITVLMKPKQLAENVERVKAAIQESFECVLREEYGVRYFEFVIYFRCLLFVNFNSFK